MRVGGRACVGLPRLGAMEGWAIVRGLEGQKTNVSFSYWTLKFKISLPYQYSDPFSLYGTKNLELSKNKCI
jgi:hypothetical protein